MFNLAHLLEHKYTPLLSLAPPAVQILYNDLCDRRAIFLFTHYSVRAYREIVTTALHTIRLGHQSPWFSILLSSAHSRGFLFRFGTVMTLEEG